MAIRASWVLDFACLVALQSSCFSVTDKQIQCRSQTNLEFTRHPACKVWFHGVDLLSLNTIPVVTGILAKATVMARWVYSGINTGIYEFIRVPENTVDS